jgi:hypothetical protein
MTNTFTMNVTANQVVNPSGAFLTTSIKFNNRGAAITMIWFDLWYILSVNAGVTLT